MKTREKFFPLLISLVLLMAIVVGSATVNASAAGLSTGYTGELPNTYDGEKQELGEEQLKMVELTQEHLKATTDSNGNIKLEIVNSEEFEHKVKESDYPIDISGIQNIIDSYNEYLTSSSKTTIDGLLDAQVPVRGGSGGTVDANVPVGGGGGGTVDTSGISCGDALAIIGLIHSGSYAYAAYLLGITGGVSIAIPFLTAAAYTVASIVCD